MVPPGVEISATGARPGDLVILSGPIAEHGMTIMATRAELELESPIASDTAPLHELVRAMLDTGGELHCLRDPTRGGVATAMCEIARQSGVGIVLDEAAILVREPVRGVCELLGLDPLYVANEGKLLAVVAPGTSNSVLARMRARADGREAQIIGSGRRGPGTARRAEDAHRWAADRGHAAGRSTPAHLLARAEPGATMAVVEREVIKERATLHPARRSPRPSRERLPLGPIKTIHVYWLAGMSCDGCTISVAGATNPGIEGLLAGTVPAMPKVILHHPVLSVEAGQTS